MKYTNFNNLGLSDEQVDAIKDCISNHIACGMTTIDDYNTQFVVYERMVGTESRGLLLKAKTTAARFHFFANLWRQPSENGRLKLKAYLEDSNAGSWRFEQQGIETFFFDRSAGTGYWRKMGTFDLSPGATLSIIPAKSKGYVAADGFALVPMAE